MVEIYKENKYVNQDKNIEIIFTWILSYQRPRTISFVVLINAISTRGRKETVIFHDYASTAGSNILSFETFG